MCAIGTFSFGIFPCGYFALSAGSWWISFYLCMMDGVMGRWWASDAINDPASLLEFLFQFG